MLALGPATPRKLPKQARAKATFEAIVEAAARILETSGTDSFGTNLIAQLAGVSPGTLYQYFPNKEAIYQALLQREAERLIQIMQAYDQGSNSLAALSALIDAIIAYRMERPNLSRILILNAPLLFTNPRHDDMSFAIYSALLRIIAPDHSVEDQGHTVVLDVISIIKGMVVAAENRGEGSSPDLKGRIKRAVLGYYYGPDLAN